MQSHDGDGLASRRRRATSHNNAEVDDALEGVGEGGLGRDAIVSFEPRSRQRVWKLTLVDGLEVRDVALKVRILSKKLSALVELLLGEPGDGVGRVRRSFERSEGEE